MTSIAFRVEGLPPKKDSGDSIWGKNSNQTEQLIMLRKQVCEAMDGRSPLNRNICLRLCVHVGHGDGRTADIDNFVGGVCDGLGAAPKNIWKCLHPSFLKGENLDVHPRKRIAIYDDSRVVKIYAEKIVESGESWYGIEAEDG